MMLAMPCIMSDLHSLTSRQADQAGTDFAAIESELEVIQKQLSRLPTPGASEDRARHHPRDDDVNDAALAG